MGVGVCVHVRTCVCVCVILSFLFFCRYSLTGHRNTVTRVLFHPVYRFVLLCCVMCVCVCVYVVCV